MFVEESRWGIFLPKKKLPQKTDSLDVDSTGSSSEVEVVIIEVEVEVILLLLYDYYYNNKWFLIKSHHSFKYLEAHTHALILYLLC